MEMRSVPVLLVMILVSLEAQAGTLYTYRAPGGAALVSNYEVPAQQVRDRGLVLEEVRYRPDTPSPQQRQDAYLNMLRGTPYIGLAPGERSGSARRISGPSNLNQRLVIPPVTINRVVIPPVTVRRADVPQKVIINPVEIPRVTVRPVEIQPPVIDPVTIRPVTISPLALPPVDVR
jgi:hypothetical protein